MINQIQQYSDIIASWQVLLHEQDGEYARLKLEIDFHDGSKLHVKDYHFKSDERKYSFHWSDFNGKLKIRWDRDASLVFGEFKSPTKTGGLRSRRLRGTKQSRGTKQFTAERSEHIVGIVGNVGNVGILIFG